MKTGASNLRILIIGVPPGEAPLWVREKWVGLELPLAQKSPLAVSRLTAGVLSGPRSLLAIIAGLFSGRYKAARGYRVDVIDAVKFLEGASPEAAAWWRANTPHLVKPMRFFLFQEAVCKLIQ